MPLYSKPSKDLVYDLINEANPGLDIPVAPANVVLGTPAVIANQAWPNNNTSIVASPAPGTSDYIGRQTLTYRRLDLSALFRGQTILIKKFKSVTSSSSGTLMYTLYQLLADINARYGMNLTEDDVTNANILRGNTLEDGQYTTTITVSTKATSLGYTGTFALKWINTKQSLEEMVTIRDIPGRAFPGGNDFSGAHKDILISNAFGLDCTEITKSGNPTWNGAAFAMQAPATDAGTVTIIKGILAAVNQKCGTSYSYDVDYKTQNGMKGLTWQAVVLPNANYPEANSTDFNRAFILKVPDDCPWAIGYLVAHLNYPY